MIDFSGLLDFAYENRLYDSVAHGLEHWHQVEYNGLLLSPVTGADVEVVRLFSIFHDCKRMDDGYDPEHGARGAAFARWCLENKLLELEKDRFEKLFHACSVHTHERKSGDPTIDTCYDADRLDLGRVGFPLDPEKMATEFGKKLARKSLAEKVSVFCMREWLRKVRIS